MTGPCATCTRRCCFEYAVTVVGYDAWTIAQRLQLAPEQFLVTIPQRTLNSRGFLLDKSEKTFDIALDKAPADTEARPCIFWLGFSGGIGRCGIYPLRPFACQVYPAHLNGGKPVRRDDVLCPEDAWREGSFEPPIWRERLLRAQVEFDIYGFAVARWNHHVLHASAPHLIGVPGFYAYLMNFYSRLEPIRTSFYAIEWMKMCEPWAACCMQGYSPLVTRVPEMDDWSEVIDGIRMIANGFFPSDLAPQSEARIPEPNEMSLTEGEKTPLSRDQVGDER